MSDINTRTTADRLAAIEADLRNQDLKIERLAARVRDLHISLAKSLQVLLKFGNELAHDSNAHKTQSNPSSNPARKRDTNTRPLHLG